MINASLTEKLTFEGIEMKDMSGGSLMHVLYLQEEGRMNAESQRKKQTQLVQGHCGDQRG